ncbi:MAG: cytochrome P450 [Pacificimonas sp.]
MATKPADLLALDAYREGREHEVFRHLRDEAPVYWNDTDDGGFWALTRHAHVSAAARDHKRLISGEGTQIRDRRAEGHGAPSVHNADAPLHARLRAPGLAAFARSRMAESEPRVRDIVRQLIIDAPVGAPFDFVARIAISIPMIVFAEVLGVPETRQQDLVRWANLMSDVRASDEDQARGRARLFGYFRQLVADRRAAPTDDVASALALAEMEMPDGTRRPLTDEELDAYFMVLTVAGNETTRFLLTGGLEELLAHPDQVAALRNDAPQIQGAVEEMARWVSPVLQMRRTAVEDMDLFGTSIVAGDKVVLYFSSANRDERVFENAAQFDVSRRPNPHLAFGVGAHFCMGAHLARLEARIFFEELFASVGDIRVIAPAQRSESNWFTGYDNLQIEWAR